MSEVDYETFDLLLAARTGDGFPITATQAPAGAANAMCRLDPADFELQEALAALEAGAVDADFLASLGSFLFEELFAGPIGELYRVSLGMARSQGRRMPVRLNLQSPELAVLPWEYLHDPSEELFLAISPETSVLRAVPLRLPLRPTAVEPPLRVLAVISNPSDAPRLDVAQEKAILQQALAEAGEKGQVRLEFTAPATVAEITQAMRRFAPHVFHFVGHGAFQHGRAYALLEDDRGRAWPLDETAFREFFLGAEATRLAVLNACQTATVSSSRPLAGLAPRLLQRKLSAVVGMHYRLSDRAALVFTREFYRSLALGAAIDVAVAEARKGIYLELGAGQRDWAAAVLCLRARDGRLFELPAQAPAQASSGERAPGVAAGRDISGQVIASEIKGDIYISAGPQLAIPPPPEPQRPPETPGFTGRASELAYFSARLAEQHLLAITGMAGVGKTALAAHLARQAAPADRIFWHSFRERQGIDVVVRLLAGFLARHGQDDLWRTLESARLSGGQAPPVEENFNQLVQSLRGRGYLLCLDDFHYVADDPLAALLIQRLTDLLAADGLALLITSNEQIGFLPSMELAGLSQADAARLLQEHGLQLDGNVLDELHRQTQGNAKLIFLAIDALRHGLQPALLIAELAQIDNIRAYLIRQVDASLSEGERAIMSALAILLGRPASREAIEALSENDDAQRILDELASRHLVAVQRRGPGRVYDQHVFVQAFYYDRLNKRRRQDLHRRAGQFYQTEEQDALAAAEQYARAGDHALAAELATGDLWAAVNRGEGWALSRLLETLPLGNLAPELRALVSAALGQLYKLRNESERARASYQQALNYLAASSPSPATQELEARICRLMAELLQLEAPQDALQWTKRGLQRLAGVQSKEEAALHIVRAGLLLAAGDLTAARADLERSLTLLDPGPSQLRAEALINLSSVCAYQGDIAASTAWLQNALEISQQLNDTYRMIGIWNNLSLDRFTSGDWTGAIEAGEQALALAERTGSPRRQVELHLNLGAILLRFGAGQAAFQDLQDGLALARQGKIRRAELIAYINLAELHLDWNDLTTAASLLDNAESLAEELQARFHLPEVWRLRALLRLAQQEPGAAVLVARQSVALTQELGLDLEEGMSLRVLGQALLAAGSPAEALTAFEQSLARLDGRDPYEAARAKAAWGRALLAAAPTGERGLSLLREAEAVFQQLGAQRDLRYPGLTVLVGD